MTKKENEEREKRIKKVKEFKDLLESIQDKIKSLGVDMVSIVYLKDLLDVHEKLYSLIDFKLNYEDEFYDPIKEEKKEDKKEQKKEDMIKETIESPSFQELANSLLGGVMSKDLGIQIQKEKDKNVRKHKPRKIKEDK